MLLDKIQAKALNAKHLSINIVLVTNAFVWYFFIMTILQTIGKKTEISAESAALMWMIHFASIIISAIIGAALARRINRTKFITLWLLFGTIVSCLSIAIDLTYLPNVYLLSLLFGVSLGIGMPSCMGYFSDKIAVEKRGLTAGVIFLLTGLLMSVFSSISEGSVGLQTIILSGWRALCLIIFVAYSYFSSTKLITPPSVEKPPHYKSVLTQRSVLVYLIPWTLFSLITYLSVPIQNTIIGDMQSNSIVILDANYLRGIENILLAVFAVVFGILIDRVGRKRVAIGGFALLGLGYSFLGIQPNNPLSWYVYTIFDGLALSILYVIFVVTIWSDLSNGAQSEKYYAIGVLPFFVSYLLKLTAGTEITRGIDPYSIFSFIAVFLFVAVLPLAYAPETLPEKVMKDRDLKSYVENAKKKAEKDAEKAHKKEKTQKNPPNQPAEDNKNYEDAKKLAEKYY